jgi:poly(hydroxyalkanoate) depolymerase family esterase
MAQAASGDVCARCRSRKACRVISNDVYVFPWVLTWFGANNQNACFNWFEPDDTVRDRGEALSIRQMIGAMIARHSIDRSRVFVVGLSAGGAMTAAMLAAYPERFAGGAIVAGVPYGCADTVAKGLQYMKPGIDQTPAEWQRRVRNLAGGEGRVPPVSIWHGGLMSAWSRATGRSWSSNGPPSTAPLAARAPR